MNKSNVGSQTAKHGFENEDFVIDIFNNWQTESLAKKWLKAMKYKIKEIQSVEAYKITGSQKADVQVKIIICIKLKNISDTQNIQVKLVSNKSGFNQIDKRWLKNYDQLWHFPSKVLEILEYYVGEKSPKISNPRDKRRMFMDEFTQKERNLIIKFFDKNKTMVLGDIIRGRGQFSAEWYLVIVRENIDISQLKWVLKNINEVMSIYDGEVEISKKGNIKLGHITIQRKGGDNGRESANMLQFKLDPTKLFEY